MAGPEPSPTTRARAPRSPAEPSAIVLEIGGRLARADLAGLCERVRALLERSNAEVVVCDVGALVDPDAVTVDALARLQLTARRLGRDVRLRDASSALRDLLVLAGLNEVLPRCGGLGLRSRGQTEEREQDRGVEEEADPVDPIA